MFLSESTAANMFSATWAASCCVTESILICVHCQSLSTLSKPCGDTDQEVCTSPEHMSWVLSFASGVFKDGAHPGWGAVQTQAKRSYVDHGSYLHHHMPLI